MPELDLSKPGEMKRVAREVLFDIDAAAVEMYSDGPRKHLGASLIGDSCLRKLWLGFRWTFHKQHDGRQQRLFNRGHKEESRFTEWLRHAGYIVNDLDPSTGQQWRVSAVGGHFGGSQDGEIFLPAKFNYSKPLLLEYKTNGTGAAFNKLKESGVAVGKPVHSDQMDTYGTIKQYEYGMYLNVNKNDDDIHVEIVKLDWDRGAKLIEKAKVIILSQAPPTKAAENRSAMVCKFCDFQNTCYFTEPVMKNCRSCRNCIPQDNKAWHCSEWIATIPDEAIAIGCNKWDSIYKQ